MTRLLPVERNRAMKLIAGVWALVTIALAVVGLLRLGSLSGRVTHVEHHTETVIHDEVRRLELCSTQASCRRLLDELIADASKRQVQVLGRKISSVRSAVPELSRELARAHQHAAAPAPRRIVTPAPRARPHPRPRPAPKAAPKPKPAPKPAPAPQPPPVAAPTPPAHHEPPGHEGGNEQGPPEHHPEHPEHPEHPHPEGPEEHQPRAPAIPKTCVHAIVLEACVGGGGEGGNENSGITLSVPAVGLKV